MIEQASSPGEIQRLLHEFQQKPEGTVREGSIVLRPSLWVAVQRLLLFILSGVGVLLFAAIQIGGPREMPALLVIAELAFQVAPVILFGMIPVIQVIFTRYVVDDEGIQEHIQVLTRVERRVRWDKVTALRYRITFLDRVFGIERLDVIAYGERGTTLRLVGLRRAVSLRNVVASRMKDATSVERLFSND